MYLLYMIKYTSSSVTAHGITYFLILQELVVNNIYCQEVKCVSQALASFDKLCPLFWILQTRTPAVRIPK